MKTVLLFSGQGSQQVGMGRSLCKAFPMARKRFEQAEAILGWPLRNLVFEGPETALTQTIHCQPALYVHGYVVFELLKAAGQLTHVLGAIGLSLGELTALAAAQVFDFETGLRLVATRARLMQAACEATQGAMASLIGGEDAAIETLCSTFKIQVSNQNCPGQRVVSGPSDAVQAAVQAAQESGQFRRVIPLNVAGAYHSSLMESARQGFEAALAPVTLKPPAFTVWSNVTGQAVSEPEAIRAGLPAQIVHTVRFEDNLKAAVAAGATHFYECGPGGVLSGLLRRTCPDIPCQKASEASDFEKLSTPV